MALPHLFTTSTINIKTIYPRSKMAPADDTYFKGGDNPEQWYYIDAGEKLPGLLHEADQLKENISRRKPVGGDLWKAIEEKLLVEWTYHSNAIEGSTLTQGETLFFLKHGLTVEGKPFKDFVDAKNHAEAIEFLYEVVQQKRDISTSLLKEFNAFLLSGISSTPAVDRYGNKTEKKATPREYKILPNHVLQSDGTIHKYTEPVHVASEMEYLCHWINMNMDSIHPLITASVAHYNMARIHPFDDGNGRGARLLMNLILIRKGFPPAIVRNESRRKYIELLAEADRGNLRNFAEFIAGSFIETQQSVLQILQGK